MQFNIPMEIYMLKALMVVAVDEDMLLMVVVCCCIGWRHVINGCCMLLQWVQICY